MRVCPRNGPIPLARMMEDDDDAKINEEIEAELDKISISSLEKDDVDTDSNSETQSDESDADLVELPESVLHCINIIKKKSKTAEELILQDLEDTDVLSYTYGAVSNNHIRLRIELSPENKENSDQLMKILSEIEKEEFLRSKTHRDRPNSVPEPGAYEHVDEHILLDDGEINFGYCEVEERCKQSFEAWQDKQKELENQEKETLKAQRDREEKQFQEEEEKRHCWMKQFEVEKEKLENMQKQEQAKMNDELLEEEKIWKEKFKQHEEFIRNLHLQMEEERTRFKDLQEKEKMRLLKMQHNAAVKIQTKYRAFVVYRKYGPIIKEQIENKKKKAQEWKEKEAKIRQMEEEIQKRLEEEKRREEEIQRQKQEERKKREKEYEEKKNILRQEKEQLLNKEKIRLKEDGRKQLMISRALKKEDHNATHLTVEDKEKNKDEIPKMLGVEKSKKWEAAPFWLDEKMSERENIDRQFALKESIPVQLKESISTQAILAEFKMEEKNEDQAKQQCSEKLVKQEGKYETIDQKTELENPDLKDYVKEQFQLQELICPIQKEVTMNAAINENTLQETQIILGHNQEINEVKNNESQKITTDNQQNKTPEVEKEEISQQNGTLYEVDDSSVISLKQKLQPLTLEHSEYIGENVILQGKEIDLKSEETKENPKGNALNSDVIVGGSDALINVERKISKQNYILGRHAPCEDLSGNNTTNSLVLKEVISLKSKIKEIPEEYHENRAECESVVTCCVPEPTLLSSIEEKRQAWIKSVKSWSDIFKQNQQKKIVKRKRLVKCPANTMPPLNTQEILQCGPWDTFQQVTRVTFQDLPGCSLSTLAECTNLQFLSLRRCGLNSLHGLNNCKTLKYIDVQENNIETIDCENLENLCVVLLNKNKLTSLHGLDGCTNIQDLELSHNKITRIGGLESLKNLQQLIVDNNQLISTKGLCDTPTIIYLDCSHNHLTKVEGIENCGLLQILKLQGNYLSEIPSLENHVLLRELYLDDNSISVVEACSLYWLPLLQNLTLSQNSLTKITPLFHFISLEKLDVSNNCLSDLTSTLKCFDACYSLRELNVTGNPLLQEINWRHSLLKILPALRILNGETLDSYSKSHIEEYYQSELGCFLLLCQSQITEFNLLIENYITGKRNIFTLDAAENLCHHFKKLMELSNQFRYAHELGDVGITNRGESEAQQNNLAPTDSDSILQNGILHSYADKRKPDLPDISEKQMDSGSHHSLLTHSLCEDTEGMNQEKIIDRKIEDSKASRIPTKRIPVMETVKASFLLKNHPNIENYEEIMAAKVIQAYWRGYIVRRRIHLSTKLHTASSGLLRSRPESSIKNQTILKEEKVQNTVNIQEQMEKAAIVIQAVWKGFFFRKKLTTALEAIKNEESEEEYEEIDLEDFKFGEAALEKEWLAVDSACFPSQTQPLPNQLCWPKFPGTLNCDDTSLDLPSRPAQAWICNEKENMFSSEHTQFSGRSENSTLSQAPESKTSRKSLLKSEKEEKISEEWGFKDISTAQQMLKRAQKMKSKKLRKKLGKEEEFICKDTKAQEKLERSKEYTYQWLHTQVGIHETTSSRNLKCNHFLPELDPDVLNGGRVQLVARLVSREDTDLELVSMTSGSALSVKKERKKQAHRQSEGSSSFSIKGILAPMIANAGPSKKERISFRDNPLQLSGGWGSGRKKAKTSN
ncbi:leucine-rich repeat and IQ domain-containing protein 1 [Pipistrellus kuhlii]|uniref:leucine-rich repeat and IQ domain-containing protein 1 n=1 Tax=Pipistrellus kuhlii TaxID=59472 RepID=UPI001E2744F1|nr:leucine-rich repeat and IQ domain-containing protein 1 [Pipistrellus kuhlii]